MGCAPSKIEAQVDMPRAKDEVSTATTATTAKQTKLDGTPSGSPAISLRSALSASILGTPPGSPIDVIDLFNPSAVGAVLSDPHFVRLVTQYQHGVEATLHEIVLQWKRLADEQARAKYILRSFDVPNHGLARVRTLYHHRRYVFTPELVTLLASYGCTAIVEYLHSKEPTETATFFTCATMDAAAQSGKLGLVEFLHAHRTEGCTHRAMDYAAMGGHMAIVEFLHVHRSEGCSVEAMNGAARKGNLEIVRFLHENRHEGCDHSAADSAALQGHLDVVRFFCDHRRSDIASDSALAAAIEKGHVAIVELLLETFPSEGNTLKMLCDAARRGHLPIIKYLYKQRAEATRYTSQAIFYANQKGHTGLVAYLEAEQRHLVSQLA
ncbi:hypothetical protein SPRG_09243 [Saprolegnia parasitica CBS 223.65]|uniref:Uncharacterized protein n=1 Tax=Saprolegnia parasitica (strain CBS 223.65) TaxID=695850 RepID=A0A067CEX7_SAPPC|nr:hypothetical protein SPRG_09243 [Saprolegnia parasitica CBS 223.65]KDO25101.1 hypothetical protein SPRG_09243 [Saprolegnia parasitica CBS 223.65]|eukprot:XP_012204174.1 hypothetical protein SPRG_09243 [Saprolegnia parasitica CBS 223.65]